MSTTVIINPKTGLGEVENPYWETFAMKPNAAYIAFAKENPALPVITAAGETLTEGQYECEKIWQYNHANRGKWNDFIIKDQSDINWYKSVKGWETREVYRVIETPELPGKETVVEVEEDSQLKPLFELIYEKYGLPLNKKQLFEIVIVCNDITNNTI